MEEEGHAELSAPPTIPTIPYQSQSTGNIKNHSQW